MRKINLALQGGGAHGAFTWGTLDRLLEEDDLEIEGISGTSAGAMNAAALKAGWVRNGNEGAREALETFWDAIAQAGDGVAQWLSVFSPNPDLFAKLVEMSPAYVMGDALTRTFSPYQLNPLNIHPLRPTVEQMLDFDKVCAIAGPKLFISATNVRTGKIKVFSGNEISVDSLLASACLPTLYQAVEIKDEETGLEEAYWDGGYMGNPALFPLFDETESADILIVHINPIFRDEVPRGARDILNRINEISFNSSLLRELRAIDFVKRLLEEGKISNNSMKDLFIHSVRDDDLMRQLGVATKLTPDRHLLRQLRDAGREAMDGFLKAHKSDLGSQGTLDLRGMFA
ncbi:MAG: patatin-like phospholipase family protein [Pseudomonadota bacterium]